MNVDIEKLYQKFKKTGHSIDQRKEIVERIKVSNLSISVKTSK